MSEHAIKCLSMLENAQTKCLKATSCSKSTSTEAEFQQMPDNLHPCMNCLQRNTSSTTHLCFILQNNKAFAEIVDHEVSFTDAALTVVHIRVFKVTLQAHHSHCKRLQILTTYHQDLNNCNKKNKQNIKYKICNSWLYL